MSETIAKKYKLVFIALIPASIKTLVLPPRTKVAFPVLPEAMTVTRIMLGGTEGI